MIYFFPNYFFSEDIFFIILCLARDLFNAGMLLYGASRRYVKIREKEKLRNEDIKIPHF